MLNLASKKMYEYASLGMNTQRVKHAYACSRSCTHADLVVRDYLRTSLTFRDLSSKLYMCRTWSKVAN